MQEKQDYHKVKCYSSNFTRSFTLSRNFQTVIVESNILKYYIIAQLKKIFTNILIFLNFSRVNHTTRIFFKSEIFSNCDVLK